MCRWIRQLQECKAGRKMRRELLMCQSNHRRRLTHGRAPLGTEASRRVEAQRKSGQKPGTTWTEAQWTWRIDRYRTRRR